MEKKPFDLEIIEAPDVHLIVASYAEDKDEVLDLANADAALDARFLVKDTQWSGYNGGYRETSATGGIVTTVLATGVITITMADTWEASGQKRILPLVYYKGSPVPYVGGSGVNGITEWDGVTAKTIKIDNTGSRYSATAADYEVTLLGDLPGQLEGVNAGGVSLPYTTTQLKSLGYRQPVSTKITEDGEAVTGDFIFHEVINMFKNGSTVWNKPGEDVEAAIFGSQWVTGQANKLTYQSNPFAMSIIEFGQNPLVSTAKAGKVFAVETRIYHCKLNNIPNPVNRSGGSTENVRKQYDFTAKNGVYRRVHLVTAAP